MDLLRVGIAQDVGANLERVQFDINIWKFCSDFSKNMLTGKIPTGITQLTALEKLYDLQCWAKRDKKANYFIENWRKINLKVSYLHTLGK